MILPPLDVKEDVLRGVATEVMPLLADLSGAIYATIGATG